MNTIHVVIAAKEIELCTVQESFYFQIAQLNDYKNIIFSEIFQLQVH